MRCVYWILNYYKPVNISGFRNWEVTGIIYLRLIFWNWLIFGFIDSEYLKIIIISKNLLLLYRYFKTCNRNYYKALNPIYFEITECWGSKILIYRCRYMRRLDIDKDIRASLWRNRFCLRSMSDEIVAFDCGNELRLKSKTRIFITTRANWSIAWKQRCSKLTKALKFYT